MSQGVNIPAQNPNMNLPVKTGDDFIGELEVMDLTELKDKQFLVAVSSHDRNGPKFVCSSIRGPFTFEEMCEAVGVTWQEHQHHCKVIILQKDFKAKSLHLDENTIDYIEAHFQDIITESMLDGVFDEVKDYTCRAGVVQDDGSENPLDGDKLAAKEAEAAKANSTDEDEDL
jgi:hypothetical protein